MDLNVEVRLTIKKVTNLQIILDQLPTIIILTDKNGYIKYINKKFERITGYSFDEVVDKNPRFLQSGKTPKSYYKTLWETLLKGETWTGTLLNRRKMEIYFG